MHFIKMDMLHIALVNVECKTLKEKDLFFTIVNKNRDEKDEKKKKQKQTKVENKICQIKTENDKKRERRVFFSERR